MHDGCKNAQMMLSKLLESAKNEKLVLCMLLYLRKNA